MTDREFRRQVRAALRAHQATVARDVRSFLRGEYDAVYVAPYVRRMPGGAPIKPERRRILASMIPAPGPAQRARKRG